MQVLVFAEARVGVQALVAVWEGEAAEGVQWSLRRAGGTDFLPTKVNWRRARLFCREEGKKVSAERGKGAMGKDRIGTKLGRAR